MSEFREWLPDMRVTSAEAPLHPSVSLRDGRARSGLLRVLALVLRPAAIAVALALLGGALGALHPAGDSLAVFRASLAGAGLVLAAGLAATGQRLWAAGALLAPALALGSLVPHWTALGDAPGDLVVYQKNLHFRSRDASLIRDDILKVAPDVVTLQEVHRNNDRIVGELAAAYPHRLACPFHARVGSVAILSRHPFVRDSAVCAAEPGLASAVIETPDGPVTVATVHQHWPWPHAQPRQAARMLEEIAALEGPAVIAGDFNMVRWSAAVERVARISGTEPVGRAAVTFPMGPEGWPIGVSIDHVLATGGQGTVEYRPLLGSDHRGAVARIALPRETVTAAR